MQHNGSSHVSLLSQPLLLLLLHIYTLCVVVIHWISIGFWFPLVDFPLKQPLQNWQYQIKEGIERSFHHGEELCNITVFPYPHNSFRTHPGRALFLPWTQESSHNQGRKENKKKKNFFFLFTFSFFFSSKAIKHSAAYTNKHQMSFNKKTHTTSIEALCHPRVESCSHLGAWKVVVAAFKGLGRWHLTHRSFSLYQKTNPELKAMRKKTRKSMIFAPFGERLYLHMCFPCVSFLFCLVLDIRPTQPCQVQVVLVSPNSHSISRASPSSPLTVTRLESSFNESRCYAYPFLCLSFPPPYQCWYLDVPFKSFQLQVALHPNLNLQVFLFLVTVAAEPVDATDSPLLGQLQLLPCRAGFDKCNFSHDTLHCIALCNEDRTGSLDSSLPTMEA